MALSATDQIQLQQALQQLAKAASSVASYSSALNNAQQSGTTSTNNLMKAQNANIDSYESLSKTLKSNSKAFEKTIQHINDYSKKVQQTKADYNTASAALAAFNQSVASAGNMMTTAQRAHLAMLNSQVAAAAAAQSTASDAFNDAFGAISDIIGQTQAALTSRTEYEKDFYGRQLAAEIKNSMAAITGAVAGKFGDQLLTMDDVNRMSQFADAQSAFIQSMIANNNTLDDSNVELGKEFIKLGEELGYVSAEFNALKSNIGAHVTGATTQINQAIIDTVVDAQVLIAESINKSNEKLSTTIDRDFKSFSGQFRRYMFDNRSQFDELIDNLRDIRTRHGSITSGAGGEEAAGVIQESLGKLGSIIVPKLSEMGISVLKHFTKEYDALTRANVETNRIVALRLNLTEEQYRQTRSENKSFWNVTSAEGQNQLDEFMLARRRQLESVFGSDPVLVNAVGSRLQGLINLSSMTESGATNLISSFKVLGKGARVTNDKLEEMYTNIALSNDNQVLMASLNEKDRKSRMESIKATMAFGIGLGMSGESLQKFTEAMTETTRKMPSAGELVSTVGESITAFNYMKTIANQAGIDLAQYGGLASSDKMQEYVGLRQKQQAGVKLSPEEATTVANMSLQIAKFKTDARAAIQDIYAQYPGEPLKAGRAAYPLLQSLNYLDDALEKTKIGSVVDPIIETLTAMKEFGINGGKIPQTIEEINAAQEELAKRKDHSTAEAVTGTAAGISRQMGAFDDSLIGDAAKILGLGAIGSTIVRYIPTILRSVIMSPLSKIGPWGWGATAVAGAGLYAYEKFAGSEEKPKATEATQTTSEQAEPGGQTQGPRPSSKIEAADANEHASDFNEMFANYMKNIETQNNAIQDFLRNISINSTGTKKVMDDWYKRYQDVNPITPMLEPDSKTDTSKP